MHILYTVQTQPVSETTGLKLILALLHLNNNFPGGSDGKEFACSVGDPGSVPGLGRSPRGGYDNPLQHSCLENTMDRGYSSWGGKESDKTE